MKIEKGVMVVKGGKAWGETQSDGHSTSYGWVDVESAPIHDPHSCKKPTDVTYSGSHMIPELLTGEVVHVVRTTTMRVLL